MATPTGLAVLKWSWQWKPAFERWVAVFHPSILMHLRPQSFPGTRATGLRRHFVIRLALVLTGCLLVGYPVPAVAASYSVQQVQAVFLFNFAQFVKWPPSAFSDANTPLTIGVLGTNSLGGALEEAIRGETVGGRRLAVKYSSRADEVKNCHIVFICRSEAGRVRRILDTLRGLPVLTVSDIPRFCEQGGMINFLVEGGRVKFSINTLPLRKADLQVSSKLLRLAN